MDADIEPCALHRLRGLLQIFQRGNVIPANRDEADPTGTTHWSSRVNCVCKSILFSRLLQAFPLPDRLFIRRFKDELLHVPGVESKVLGFSERRLTGG